MATVDRLVDRGTRRAERALQTLADDYRDKRVAAGLTQQSVADSAGVSRSTYQRFERGSLKTFTLLDASRVAAVLGLDLSVRAYPGASPLRDSASLARLCRVLSNVAAPLTYRTEVPLPKLAERPFEQRAWDAMIFGYERRTAIELEMRIRDAQALERRMENKRRDDPADAFVLLAADTSHNRVVLREHPRLFPELTRISFRELSRLLRSAQHPPSSLVLV